MRITRSLAAVAAGSMLVAGLAVATAGSAFAADDGPLLTGNVYLFKVNSAGVKVGLDTATNADIVTSGDGVSRPFASVAVDQACPATTTTNTVRVRIPQAGVDPLNWDEVPINALSGTKVDGQGHPYNDSRVDILNTSKILTYIAAQGGVNVTLPMAFTCLDTGGNATGYFQTTLTMTGTATALTSWSVPAPPAIAARVASTTTLTASAPTVETGTPVTFTATVPSGATGTVQFKDGATALGSPVTVTGGIATYTSSTLTIAAHSVTAVYSGDSSGYFPSTSSAATVQVTTHATTTALAASAATVETGTAVTFTATVAPATATGTVQFNDGTTALGSPVALNVSGVATYTSATLAITDHSVTAVYSGDAVNGTSTSLVVTVRVTALNPRSTTTTLTVSPVSGDSNQSVAFTATVTSTAGLPNGAVAFTDVATTPATVLGSATVTAGVVAVFSTNALGAGTHALVATFTGTAPYTNSDTTSTPISATYVQKGAVPDAQTVDVTIPEGAITITTPYNPAYTDAAGVAHLANPLHLGIATLDPATSTFSASAPFGTGVVTDPGTGKVTGFNGIVITDGRAGNLGFTASVISGAFTAPAGTPGQASFVGDYAGLTGLVVTPLAGNALDTSATALVLTNYAPFTPGIGTAKVFAHYLAGQSIGTAQIAGTFGIDKVPSSVSAGLYTATVTFTAV
jgi:Bacterial Ig-like domain (group 3)